MKREFKFRAWNKEKKCMSDEFTFDNFDVDYFIPDSWFLLDMEIMEFTGLKDKNGKEIYEGDIVKDSNDYYDTIIFGKIGYDSNWNGLTGFCLKGWCNTGPYIEGWFNEKTDFFELRSRFNPKEIEVIGNIYENPELCK